MISSAINNVGGGNFATPFEVISGELIVSGFGGMTSDDAIQIDAAATLNIESSLTANVGTEINGTGGTLLFSDGGVMRLDTNTTLDVNPVLELFTGSIQGSAAGGSALQCMDDLFADNGTINGASVTANKDVYFQGRSGTALTLEATDLTLNQVGVWQAGNIDMGSSTLQNNGTFYILTDSSIVNFGGGGFWNAAGGKLTKIMGDGTTVFGVPLSDDGNVSLNGRTIRCAAGLTQSNGVVDLGGGTLTLGALGDAGTTTYFLEGGRLEANGSITNGKLLNRRGVIEIADTLTLDGDFEQTSTGTLQIDASGDSSSAWGQLNATGTAVLEGTLTVSLAPGYNPQPCTIGVTILAAGQGVRNTFSVTPPDFDVYYPDGISVYLAY
jgi:hypothetical protein